VQRYGVGLLCIQSLNNRPLLSLSLATLVSSTSPQKPPASYTRVNDFGPHTDSIFRGRLIRESDLYASIYGTLILSMLTLNKLGLSSGSMVMKMHYENSKFRNSFL